MELEKKGIEERGVKTSGGFPGPSLECQQDQALEIFTDDIIGRGRGVIDFSSRGSSWNLMFAPTLNYTEAVIPSDLHRNATDILGKAMKSLACIILALITPNQISKSNMSLQ